ncbi:TonB-dependent receptor [Sphingomonas gei]|uniref:TonB-dependent receptor n=2 Tax=Sphingomonas gei TaxID=1395960 RepID=A0A4S1X013_9SPHN|nr:TonB-dependent receptor [Sphingomonas gei]
MQVSVDAATVRGVASAGATGKMSRSEALARLLAGSGYAGQIDGRVVTLAPVGQVEDGAIATGPLQVQGDQRLATTAGEDRDARGADDIYDRDATTTYMGKDEVERYKGVTSSDVLKGMLGVYSGDARNGGAIDPSIRGVSGPGRVPVIIDGTEQALTVWRGYNGVSNRAYIDPNLISGIQVEKGPVAARGVNGSIGGAVVIHTLDADDILRKDQKFGIEVKLEGGNNSTEPRWPHLFLGQDYHNIPGYPGSRGTPGNIIYPANDPAVLVMARTSHDNDFFSLGDKAARVALAGRLGDLDLFGAYAYRTHGNYFAGESGAGYYSQNVDPKYQGTFVQRMAFNYLPGTEITNTSSRTSSWLGKLVWHISDVSDLKAGYRDTRSTYGDIMASRLLGWGGHVGSIQWPASHVHAQAYNLDYRLQPGLWWLDLKASFWDTHTLSDTNSNGGYPESASYTNPILQDTASAHSRNDRFGVIASNQLKLGSRLDLLVQGNWQREVLRPRGESLLDATAPKCASFFCGTSRSGRREEYRIDLKSEWRPFSFLKLNAGLTYAGFHATDDYLRDQIAAGKAPKMYPIVGYSAVVDYNVTDAQSWNDYLYLQYFNPNDPSTYLAQIKYSPYDLSYNGIRQLRDIDPFFVDQDGKFTRGQNPCLNGTFKAPPFDPKSCKLGTSFQELRAATYADTHLAARNWAPMGSATVYLSTSSRFYVRYAEAYRYPSIFESTIGFSQSYNPLARVKPEHAHSLEAAFVQDMGSTLGLGRGQKADLKLTWYRNVTTDVIERNTNLVISNIDKQILSGLEVQARYDNGWLFGDFGYAHVFTNKVCDQSTATTLDSGHTGLDRIPDCVKYGFYGGYLLTQAAPDNSLNLTLGARVLNRRLEFGPRFTWYSEYKNKLLDTLVNVPDNDKVQGYALNVPYAWGANLTVDAYVRFRINPRFTAEIDGTNLTDRYYGDPLTRSLNPAPGRTVRISLTGRL